VRGFFFSQKSKALIPWESRIEFRACALAEFNRSILLLKAHQQRITVTRSVDSFDAYPDFCFVMADGSNMILEVKGDHDLKDEQVRSRLAAIRSHFEGIGTDYEVWSETYVNEEPRCSTLDELLFYRKPSTRSMLSKKDNYHTLKSRYSTLPFLEAAEYLGGQLGVRKYLANDLLYANFSLPLTDFTPVTVH
jgi:hypothetical protein